MNNFKFGNRSMGVLNNPLMSADIVTLSHKALNISLYDFGFGDTSGIRTRETQYNLYLNGKSSCDGKQFLSRHQPEANASGKCEAIDFYGYNDKGQLVDGTTYEGLLVMTHIALAYMQAGMILGIPVESGVFFDTIFDVGHIQLKNSIDLV